MESLDTSAAEGLTSQVLVYALVSARARETVELFLDRATAQAAMADALADEPSWEGVLSVVALDFGRPPEDEEARWN